MWASRAEPYLALAVELDAAILLDLAGQVEQDGGGRRRRVPAVLVNDTEAAVADWVVLQTLTQDMPDGGSSSDQAAILNSPATKIACACMS